MLGLGTSLFNIPQTSKSLPMVSSFSPSMHLAKASAHSLSSYFQLLTALGAVDHRSSLNEMLDSPSFRHCTCQALLPPRLLSPHCWPSPQYCSPRGLCPKSLYLLYLKLCSRYQQSYGFKYLYADRFQSFISMNGLSKFPT